MLPHKGVWVILPMMRKTEKALREVPVDRRGKMSALCSAPLCGGSTSSVNVPLSSVQGLKNEKSVQNACVSPTFPTCTC